MVECENVQHYMTSEEMEGAISKGEVPVMRSKLDDLTVWQSVTRYKLVALVAMAAAFSASLDGYRQYFPETASVGFR